MKTYFLCIAMMLAGDAVAQDDPGDPVDDARAEMELEAQRLLESIDKRIYYPRRQGLKDVQFRYHVKSRSGEGESESGKGTDFFVYFAWKAPQSYRMELQDRSGGILTETPPFFREAPQELERLRQSVQAMAVTWLIGLPLGEAYRDYYKELKSREVNNKREWRIIMVPKRKKLFNKVVLVVRDGLLREVSKTLESGRSTKLFYRYAEVGDRHICSGYRQETGNRVMNQEEYSYVVKKDITVLSSIKRLSRSGPVAETVIRLEDLTVNADLKDTFFAPPKRP